MNSPLFNEITITRLCQSIQITDEQKLAADRWISFLESDSLKKEKQAYIEFANTILNKILGYNIGLEELKHEEDFLEFSFKDKSGKKKIFFETKGTKTKDLTAKQYRKKLSQRTPLLQTWDYMSQMAIPYGVATNYKDFILLDFSKGYRKFHKFDFLSIKNNDDKLKEFIAIFSKPSVLESDFLSRLYSESVTEEKQFTNEFYNLFHETRLMLIKEFQNHGIMNGEAIKNAQLFLNRLIFIYFAEDTGLLNRRLFEEVVLNLLENPVAIDENTHIISDVLKNLFLKLDKGTDIPTKIFGFNGELFKDIIPNSCHFLDVRKRSFFENIKQSNQIKKPLKLDDFSQRIINLFQGKLSPLIKNLLLMAIYDFKTEINVNILGHIFEQSISDLEELKGQKITKRKKEGIYYTPEYVTDYICRNTLIPYFSNADVNTVEELILEFQDNVEELETKFKKIKILDPACGSGAFLLKVVDILLEIKKEIILLKESKGEYITELKKTKKAKKTSKFLSFEKFNEIEEAKEIIKSNIFGVDLNEESVEITKLSIFLKIARKDSKLINLLDNIKCGNSLFEETEYAGEKAFDWASQFSEIMESGGFDVIIGNPPYVDIKELDQETVDNIFKKYEFTFNRMNLYSTFVERSYNLLTKNGYFGFIIPNSILYNNSYSKIRLHLVEKSEIKKIVRLPDKVFENVSVETIILIFTKSDLSEESKCEALVYKSNDVINTISPNNCLEVKNIIQNRWLTSPANKFNLIDESKRDILRKIENDTSFLGSGQDCICDFSLGITPYDKYTGHTPEQIKNKVFHSTIQNDETYKPLLSGANIIRFIITKPENRFIKYGEWLGAPREERFFIEPRIIVRQIISGIPPRIYAGFTEDPLYNTQIGFNLLVKNKDRVEIKYLLAVLNSKLINFYHRESFLDETKTTFQKILIENAKIFPIKIVPKEQQLILVQDINLIMKITVNLMERKKTFLNRISDNFEIDKLGKKLESFSNLSFKEFLKELKKRSKMNISLNEQDELEIYFNKYSLTVNDLFEEIQALDEIIDARVYQLYNLSEEEILVIES